MIPIVNMPRPVAPFRPVYATRRMGQLVEVTPDVTVEAPIQIGLGPIPLSALLFGGALVSFAVSAFLPKGAGRTLAMIAGGGCSARSSTEAFRSRPGRASWAP